MKALTICEPFASAFLRGPKDVENRVWQTTYRGWLLVHAGKRSMRNVWDANGFGRLWPEGDVATLQFGALIGIVRITDCYRDTGCNPWGGGPWCWQRDGARLQFAHPVTYRGRQGLWDVPDMVVARALTGGWRFDGQLPSAQEVPDLRAMVERLLHEYITRDQSATTTTPTAS